MGTVSDARKEDYAVLEAGAIASLNRAAEDLVNWVELIRDPDMPWAFRWAPGSVRAPNVGATNYILEAARRCGVLDRILTPEQRRLGSAWIHSLEVGHHVFADPALLDRKPPAWDDSEENWPPDGAHKEAINQYALGCLRYYEDRRLDVLAGPPPPTWPQKGDTDGGISSYADGCIPTWLKWDMAPAVPQGDVFGWCIYSAGMNICVGMLGIADRVSWTGRWRQRDDYDTTPFVDVGKSLLMERVPTT